MKTRTRITRTVLDHEDRQFTLTFCVDGLHIREKFGREERIISLKELVFGPSKASKANPNCPPGSLAEAIDVAACDLHLMADGLSQKKQFTRAELSEIRHSVSVAQKIVKSLETLA
jgi:hypothetical protein